MAVPSISTALPDGKVTRRALVGLAASSAAAGALSFAAAHAQASELAELIADAEWRYAEWTAADEALDHVESEFLANHPVPFVSYGRRLVHDETGALAVDPVTGDKLWKPWRFFTDECIDKHFGHCVAPLYAPVQVDAAERRKGELKHQLSALQAEHDRQFEARGGPALVAQSEAAFKAWRSARQAVFRYSPTTVEDFQLKYEFLFRVLDRGFGGDAADMLVAVFGDQARLGELG